MPNQLKLFIIIGISLLMFSCNESTTFEKPINYNYEGLIPTDEGIYWKYESIVLYEDGSEMSIYDTLSRNIAGHYEIEYVGELYDCILHNELHHTIGDAYTLYWQGPDGLYRMGAKSDEDFVKEKTLYLQYPVAIGDSLQYLRLMGDSQGLLFYDDTVTVKCIDTAQIFSTPLGDFECYVFQHYGKRQEDVGSVDDYYRYYSPGYGLVGLIVKGYNPYTNEDYGYKRKLILIETNVN